MCASAPPSMASGITAKSKQSFKGELSSGCETERVLRGCCCLLPSDAAAAGSHESLPPVGDRFSPFRGEMSPQVTKWGTGGCDRREQTNEGAPLDGANGCSPLIRHFVPPVPLLALRATSPGAGESFPKGGKAFGKTANFTAPPKAPPRGGAVAQRLRGNRSAEPEKTVKRSSRRRGVNLQFFPVEPTALGLSRASSP